MRHVGSVLGSHDDRRQIVPVLRLTGTIGTDIVIVAGGRTTSTATSRDKPRLPVGSLSTSQYSGPMRIGIGLWLESPFLHELEISAKRFVGSRETVPVVVDMLVTMPKETDAVRHQLLMHPRNDRKPLEMLELAADDLHVHAHPTGNSRIRSQRKDRVDSPGRVIGDRYRPPMTVAPLECFEAKYLLAPMAHNIGIRLGCAFSPHLETEWLLGPDWTLSTTPAT